MPPFRAPTRSSRPTLPDIDHLAAFDLFDAVRCVRVTGSEAAWTDINQRAAPFGLARRMIGVALDPMVVETRTAIALAFRQALEGAVRDGAERVLMLEDTCLFLGDAGQLLQPALDELGQFAWSLLYLGAATWGLPTEAVAGCRHLHRGAFGGTHAIAYSRATASWLLDVIPDTAPRIADWIAPLRGYDRFLASLPDRLLASPVVASTATLLPYEDPALRTGFVT